MPGKWQNRLFLGAGLVAAVLLASTAVRSVVGLATSHKPTPVGELVIPPFADLVACNAHFSHEILRIKNRMPAHNAAADLPLLHRNYRRLHRLMRQVGRRDGIAPEVQSQRLRRQVNRLNARPGTAGADSRDAQCRAMAEMPIARRRNSQRIVGR